MPCDYARTAAQAQVALRAVSHGGAERIAPRVKVGISAQRRDQVALLISIDRIQQLRRLICLAHDSHAADLAALHGCVRAALRAWVDWLQKSRRVV